MIRSGLHRVEGALERALDAVPERVRWWTNVAVLVAGLAALFVAAVLIVQPAALEQVVDPAAVDDALTGRTGIVAVVAGILLGALISIWKGATATRRGDDSQIRKPDASVDRSALAGHRFDQNFRTAVETAAEEERTAVTDRLRSVAVEAIATRAGEDDAAVREEVLTGEWTDDVVAGSFLGDERAADPPLRWRLYAWLYPDRAFSAAVERTIDEIETYDPEAKR